MKRMLKFAHLPVFILSMAILFGLMPVMPVQAGQDSIRVFLQDQQLSFTVPPQTINNRVMVPMRPIFEAMGAALEWDAATQTATAVKGSTTVVTQIGNTTATINETEVILDAAPTAINGSTLAPLRFVAEAFGYEANWDGASQTAYINSADQMSRDSDMSQVKAGDIVYYGNYKQDSLLLGPVLHKDPIAWRVLAVESDRVLLISELCLEQKEYNETNEEVTWEFCTLRKWLNNDFINEAFTSEEQAKIATTSLPNPDNARFGTEGGNTTQDRVFLLNVDEVELYFAPDEDLTDNCGDPVNFDRCTGVTDYAYLGIVFSREFEGTELAKFDKKCRWWLRSPGGIDTIAPEYVAEYGPYIVCATVVSNYGQIVLDGSWIDRDGVGVRPAMWLNR